MQKKLKKNIYAISLLAGTIIGVGLFSLPYIMANVGIFVFLGYFILIGLVVIFVHILFGEVSLKTPDYLRFSGFAKTHLGKLEEKITSFSIIFSLLGSLLAYLIVGSKFLSGIFFPIFNKNEFFYVFLYFLLGGIFLYFGLRAISKVEFWGLFLFIFILFLICIYLLPNFKISNFNLFPVSKSFKSLFLPYGPILYSLWGAALIPDTEEILGKDKKYLKKVIFVSILIPAFVYLLFSFIILGTVGKNVSEEALSSLSSIVSPIVLKISLFFGFLTTFTSYIALGLTLKKMFVYDYKLNEKVSFSIVAFSPLIFYLLGFKNFINVISFIGAVFLGISGIMIILMYQKIKKADWKIKLLTVPLILVFIFGILYQIIYFFI